MVRYKADKEKIISGKVVPQTSVENTHRLNFNKILAFLEAWKLEQSHFFHNVYI